MKKVKNLIKTSWQTARAFLPTWIIVVFILSGLALGSTAVAQLNFPGNYPNIPLIRNAPQAYTPANAYTLQDIVNILGQVRNFILIVGIIFIVIMIIWAGIDYVTARGDEEKLAAAKNKLVGAIIGAAIILAAFALIATIRSILSRRSLLGP